MRIKELVEKSGVPRTTIHFYLRQGLLHPPHKTGRTMAYYDESHLKQLKEIQNLKKGARVPIAFLKEQVNSINQVDSPVSTAYNGYDVGKPVTTTKEKKKKRQEIIKHAIQIFSHKGYHQTKISDITGSMKISTGTFYLYFNNKRDLFIEVIDDVFHNIVGEAAVAIKGEEDFLKKLKIRGRVFLKNYTKYSEILNQLRAEMAGEDNWPVKKIKKIYHHLTRPVIKEIQDAVDAGIIRKIDPDLAAYDLTGQLEMMSLRLSLDDKYNIEDAINFIVDLSLDHLFINDKNDT
ncbi:MAG: MerR family transcriptional regulator [Desulfobacteraceae bacterium]|nr:MerR family transcriptional regulator [Desulfobacteraceae bacterium]MBC2756584.1 MerR family transcriptional regulator [Desulfobacteraceae bacterium]